jgi:hypothetical protein
MYEIILRRVNGRFVKSVMKRSRYAAKQKRVMWEDKYDSAYYVEIIRVKTK